MTAMEHLVEMYEEIHDNQAWNTVYQEIDRQSCKQEEELKLTTEIAHSWENSERNRYRNVLAYDSTRVVLKGKSNEDSDYINASSLLVPSAKRNYILTQGPLSTTSNDFWQMVWEQSSTLIIMLNRLVEKGVPKCHDYFPSLNSRVREFDSFNVVLKDEQNFDHYVIRDMELLCKKNELLNNTSSESWSRPVKHFQFISWPDFGVPNSTFVFIDFLQKIRDTNLLLEKTPTVVHCSAGIGRSGTFVVADSVLSMVEQNVEKIDVIDMIVEMRKSRMGLIQTPQQLQFCWKTIVDAIKQELFSKKKSYVEKSVNGNIEKNLFSASTNCVSQKVEDFVIQKNEIPIDSHANLCGDSSARKRTSADASDLEKEAKQARRKQRIEEMRQRLLKCDKSHKNWRRMAFGSPGIGYACATVAVAFAVYYIYRLIS
ncbi:unnamed protein product [Thelazia callipaeda]|uniref:protein-tyrosine-phosphatase n=1 Tax=Thelazia callipaeda TaxID=103827 RepID=A0A0N5D0G7_THECL|nr:unnamed protein product [Thelazia callipaeda]